MIVWDAFPTDEATYTSDDGDDKDVDWWTDVENSLTAAICDLITAAGAGGAQPGIRYSVSLYYAHTC